MNCPECGCPVADASLGCRPCLEKRALADAMRLAASRVPEIAAGRLLLRLMRKAKGSGTIHAALPNFPTHGWCGADLRDCANKDNKKLEEAFLLPAICGVCMQKINELIEVES